MKTDEPYKPTQEDYFLMHMPSNLYLNHYKLHEIYHDYTAEQWRTFLKEKEHFIRTEISAITEAEARSALQKLSQGNAKSADISAIKQLMEQAENLNSKTKDQRTFVVTSMPSHQYSEIPKKTLEEQQKELVLKNKENVDKMFEDVDLYSKKNVFFNADGTLHFRPAISQLDSAYLRLFNPENKHFEQMPPRERGDVQ